jgi:hypothetical protein
MFFEGLTRLAMGLAHLFLSEMILFGLHDRSVSEFKGTSPTTTQFAYCWPPFLTVIRLRSDVDVCFHMGRPTTLP